MYAPKSTVIIKTTTICFLLSLIGICPSLRMVRCVNSKEMFNLLAWVKVGLCGPVLPTTKRYCEGTETELIQQSNTGHNH